MNPPFVGTELRQSALAALAEPDPANKIALTRQLRSAAAELRIDTDARLITPPLLPGQPARPELRAHLDIPKRSPFTSEGLSALLHAVTHIEFNAINLALDAIWRFAGLPRHTKAAPLVESEER